MSEWDLPSADVDERASQRIAARARMDLGRGRPRGRLVLPIAAAILVAGYMAWAIVKLVDILR